MCIGDMFHITEGNTFIKTAMAKKMNSPITKASLFLLWTKSEILLLNKAHKKTFKKPGTPT